MSSHHLSHASQATFGWLGGREGWREGNLPATGSRQDELLLLLADILEWGERLPYFPPPPENSMNITCSLLQNLANCPNTTLAIAYHQLALEQMSSQQWVEAESNLRLALNVLKRATSKEERMLKSQVLQGLIQLYELSGKKNKQQKTLFEKHLAKLSRD